jgi:hypothetical protein
MYGDSGLEIRDTAVHVSSVLPVAKNGNASASITVTNNMDQNVSVVVQGKHDQDTIWQTVTAATTVSAGAASLFEVNALWGEIRLSSTAAGIPSSGALVARGAVAKSEKVSPASIVSSMVVPAVDAVSNVTWGDVIGNKTDTVAGGSLYALVLDVYENVNRQVYVYPTLAAGATVVSANANWAYGAYAEVVPASTITSDFHIRSIQIETCDENAIFQLELYSGASDTLVSAIRFSVAGGFFGNSVYVIGSAHIAANSRMRARLASSNGLAAQATATISISYVQHT